MSLRLLSFTAACFQQKTGDAQESGFHSRVWKAFVFRVLTFPPVSPIFVPFCSILPRSSISAPFCCITPCPSSNLFSSPSLHCYCLLSQTALVCPLGSLFEISVPPFPHVQGVFLPSKAQLTFDYHGGFVLPFSLLVWLLNLTTPFLQISVNQSCIFFLPCC